MYVIGVYFEREYIAVPNIKYKRLNGDVAECISSIVEQSDSE